MRDAQRKCEAPTGRTVRAKISDADRPRWGSGKLFCAVTVSRCDAALAPGYSRSGRWPTGKALTAARAQKKPVAGLANPTTGLLNSIRQIACAVTCVTLRADL